MTDMVVNFFEVFNMHLEKDYCSDIKFLPRSLISTTITRFSANLINLSAVIVELRLAECGRKLRSDLQIVINGINPDVLEIPPEKNTENIAAKFCTACPNTLMHIL